MAIAGPLKMAGYLEPCQARYRVADLTDMVSRMWRQMRGFRRGIVFRALAGLEIARLSSWERQIARRFDLVLLASPLEAAELARLEPRARIRVVPNAVDIAKFIPLPDPGSNVVIFWGHLRYPPNADGVLWFARQVLPIVRASIPDCTFWVVGGDAPQRVQILGNIPGVKILGAVADLRAYVARASLVVVPILYGSGTRFKILEALALGRAVVSTPAGAEGLDLAPGVDIELAGSAVEFADKVVKLLRDSQHRAKLAASGRQRVVQAYSLQAASRHLDDALSSLLD